MTTTLRKLKKDHYELITEYVELLNQVSKLPWISPVTMGRRKEHRASSSAANKSVELRVPLALRYLVRLFAETHIKTKLNELSIAYAFLAQQNHKDKRFVTWLKETGEDCDKLAATLTSWQSFRGLFGGLWPVVLGIVTALLNLQSIYDIVKTISIQSIDWLLVVLMLLPPVYLLFFMSFSFLKKRELFLHGFVEDDRRSNTNPQVPVDSVIYHLEDKVFDQIGRGKIHEFPTDIFTQVAVFVALAVFELSVWIEMPDLPLSIIFAVGVLFFTSMAVLSLVPLRQRKLT